MGFLKFISPPQVYLDANIIKNSASELFRLFPSKQTIDWGKGHPKTEIIVHDLRTVNPHDRIKPESAELKREAGLLRSLAELAKKGEFLPIMGFETVLETWRMDNLDSMSGQFYGAPIRTVPQPQTFVRELSDFKGRLHREQIVWIRSIEAPRFIEIQKAVGAYKGRGRGSDNQLLDAFYIWTAEFNGADFFLTMDFTLIRLANSDKKRRVKIKLLKPSELLTILNSK